MGDDSGFDPDFTGASSLAYVMSIQPHASLTKIGLAAPIATMVGIVLNVLFFLFMNRRKNEI